MNEVEVKPINYYLPPFGGGMEIVMKYTLGISDSVHDQSVCLIKNDIVISMIELERLIRKKHAIVSIPGIDFAKDNQLDYFMSLKLENKSTYENESLLQIGIDYCLEMAGIKEEDVDLWIGSSLHYHRPFQDKMVWINHYLSHASACYYTSKFEESLIIIIDGYGDSYSDNKYETAYFAIGRNNKIIPIKRLFGTYDTYYSMTNSLGVMYRNASVLTGFNLFGQGKVMGLAPFGKPVLIDKALEYLCLLENGLFELDNKGLFKLFEAYLSNYQKKDEFQVKANVAYAYQFLLEHIVIHMVNSFVKETSITNLCIGGGIAINSVLNSKILTETNIKNLFVYPAPGDNGISHGAALWGAYNLLDLPRSLGTNFKSASLGKRYTNIEIINSLSKISNSEKGKIKWSIINEDELFNMAAKDISEGKIIGWFRGGSEIGPRALGNRSILADPRKKEMKEILNNRIKHREGFRPFAPSILYEYSNEYFYNEIEEPYMLRVVKVKEKALMEVPAIIHIDQTARIQTVHKELNSDYYKLIQTFYNITNVPLLLNTSFNINNEPIVENPENAINTFIDTELDKLYIENIVVEKIS